MSHHQGCVCLIIPPYMYRKLLQSPDPTIRQRAQEALQFDAMLRSSRTVRSDAPGMSAIPAGSRWKERLAYDMHNRSYYYLPGELRRRENQAAVGDESLDQAFDSCGTVFDFFRELFGRTSLDNRGMALISSVHVGRRYNNAFWNGEQIAFGDGDGVVFGPFTRSLDVVAHELTHGVVTHTSNLEYRDEPGALNEHFADVFGVLVKQWCLKQTAAEADWLVGADLIVPSPDRAKTLALRTFRDELAYDDDPYLGDDPQPKHYSKKYEGEEDGGGVHINSGIPNHAFFLVAQELGGNAWERAGRIWYDAMLALTPQSDFREMKRKTLGAAIEIFGCDSPEHRAVASAWQQVGL